MYLGDGATITLIKLSDDEFTQGDPGQMTAANTGDRVIPDLTATNLVYITESIAPIYSRVFVCVEKDTNNARFFFAWNVRGGGGWQWFIGSPHLSGEVKNGSPVQFSAENITRQVANNSVSAIERSFASMRPGTPFKDEMFKWTRSGGDDNFQVFKEITDVKKWYWKEQETMPVVTLTDNVAQGGRFDYTQT